MNNYDVVVIGAGPGGYVCAIRSAQLGLKTAVIEKKWLGGVCLNVGCIPSKALLKNAEVAHILRTGSREFGFSFENLKLDYGSAVKRSRKVSNRLSKGVGFLLKKNKIDVYEGTATLPSKNTVRITGAEEKTTDITASNTVVATGAKSAVPPGWQIDGKYVLTYLEAILQETLPESAIIIGSGAIGVEFATIWNSYGVDVTIVEMLPRLVPLEDQEISTELKKAFRRRKIKTLTNHRVESIEVENERVHVTVSSEGGQSELEAQQALVAVGFKPNSQGLGLESLGVQTSSNGAVEIENDMSTNVPCIWAVGDVTDKLMLAHVGSAQGTICAENMAGIETHTLDYEMMPRATYCQPQIASFGLSEKEATQRGYRLKIGRFPFRANGKALGLGESGGWIKIICDGETRQILGAHLIGPEVTELLPELTLSQMLELTPENIGNNVHAHPTLSEVIMEAAHDALGNAIHK